MQKVPTIFERDYSGDFRVIDKYAIDPEKLKNAIATEKINGTNVRLTIRNSTVVRVEKRRNPSKALQALGIKEPWYVDANPEDLGDAYLFEAASHTDFSDIPDGEWSGEAVGPKIQGNWYGLQTHTVLLFSLRRVPVFENVPITYSGLYEWFNGRKSLYSPSSRLEGIVWHCENGEMFKIKALDFIGKKAR